MKALAIFLLLLCSAVASTTVNTSGSTTVNTGGTTAVTNTNPSYSFYNDFSGGSTAVPQWPLWGPGSGAWDPGSGDPPIVQNSDPRLPGGYYAHIPTTDVHVDAQWWNDSNAQIFATPNQGFVSFWFRYTSTFAGGALLMQIGGKRPSGGPLDTNDGIGINTAAFGSGSATFGLNSTFNAESPGVDVTLPNRAFSTQAEDTWYFVRLSWNLSARYKAVLQINSEPPTYSTTAFGPWRCNSWGQFQIGNDTTALLELDETEFLLSPLWSFTLPVSLWETFEFTTVSQANLEANDNAEGANGFTWNLSGTTSRFSTSTSAKYVSPFPINSITDTGTRGFVNDLNATAQANVSALLAAATTGQRAFGFFVKTAAIASGTSARISFAGSSATAAVVAVDQQNTAGQQELVIKNNAGTASTAVSVTADTWYWVTVSAFRNNTCTLRVYDPSTKTEISGSNVTVTGTNASIDRFAIGSNTTSTSQTAGLVHYVSNFVVVSTTPQTGEYPLLPWP